MTVNRRTFLSTATAFVAVLALPIPFAAAATPAEVDDALAAILGDREGEEGGITLDVPNVAENGAQVPITIHVDNPMSDDDHVTAIHIVATQNPTPGIGTFRLTRHVGRAEVSTRIRLAEGQEVLVLAELSDGRVLKAAAEITVTLGGCAT